MSTPPGPYDQTPPSGEYPQNPSQIPPYQGAPQPPPYGQPPYGQPYAQQAPYQGYPVPPQPRTNSHRTLWIVLGVVGGVLLLACIACVAAAAILVPQLANNPTVGSSLTVASFCANEEQQNYSEAYDMFSTDLQSQMTRDQFIAASQAHDQAAGTVTNCTLGQPDSVAASDTTASYSLEVTRGSGAAETSADGTISLLKENGSWKIESLDASLGLT